MLLYKQIIRTPAIIATGNVKPLQSKSIGINRVGLPSAAATASMSHKILVSEMSWPRNEDKDHHSKPNPCTIMTALQHSP